MGQSYARGEREGWNTYLNKNGRHLRCRMVCLGGGGGRREGLMVAIGGGVAVAMGKLVSEVDPLALDQHTEARQCAGRGVQHHHRQRHQL